MFARLTCTDCGVKAPVTRTIFTLIGINFGWRIVRRRPGNTASDFELRCPSCWRKRVAS